MSTPSMWRSMTAELPVISVQRELTASFGEAQPGQLSIQVQGKLPEGKLVLVAASTPHSRYWYQVAETDGNTVTAEMDSFGSAWAACGDPAWTLSLGRITGDGVVLYPLRGKGSVDYVKTLDQYFCDDRRRYARPAGGFQREKIAYEVLPRYTERKYLLSLLVTTTEGRWASQVSCHLEDCTWTEDLLTVTIQCPEGLEQPEGVSFHDTAAPLAARMFFPGKAVGEFAQSHQIRADIPLSELSQLNGTQALTCVLGREEGLLLWCPVHMSGPQLGTKIPSAWEFHPFLKGEKGNVYLSVDEEYRLILERSEDLPGAQRLDDTLLKEYLASEDCRSEHYVTGINEGGSGWQWKLRLPGIDLKGMDEVALCLEKQGSSLRLECPAGVQPLEHGTLLNVDLHCLAEQLESCLMTDWFPVLALRRGSCFWYLPVVDPVHALYRSQVLASKFSIANDLNRLPIGETEFAGRTVEVCPHWAAKYGRRMCLRMADQCLRHMASFACRASEGTLRFGRLNIRIQCPKVQGKWVGVMITHRYKLEQDRKDYFFPVKSVRDCGDHTELTASVNIRRLEFTPLYWDIRAVVEQDGIPFWIPVRAPIRSTKKKDIMAHYGLRGLLFGESAVLNKDYQLFLYRTMINRFALVCQERTPYSGFWFRLKERFAFLLYVLFRKKLSKDNIMLTYEKYCCMAQDNGFYFFKYCMDNDLERQMKRKIYFVIDKKAVDYRNNLLPYKDHVIQFMSLKHMVYLLACRLMVSSDSKAHAYAWRCKESIIQPYIEKNRRLVFLQHGVIALKKVDFFRSGTNVVDLFVTSNDREHDIIVEELGYQPQEVIITGLARWDVLEDRSGTAEKRTILVMPTWRNWLEEVSDETFRQSDYYRNYMELLNSPRLEQYLEQYDLYLNFYIHPKFREYIGNFSISGDRVRLIPFGSEPLNRLIMECSMLITDYSSVCWDVYYQGKPVLFYQFDVDKYNETQGAYIDLETELFGDRAVNNDQLFALMEEEAADDFRLKPKYAEMRRSMYKYIDRNNSKRVCEEIRKRNW